MAYSVEIVQRARQKLARAREDRESENRQHLAEAYAKVPRIRQIDMELRNTMAMAAQAVFSSGGDARAAMEQVREANLALQREREALAKLHFPEGYLDDSPICPRCGGTGYVGTQMCECLTELCRQEQKMDLSLVSGSQESFNKFRLEYYSDLLDSKYNASPRTIMEIALRTCRSYAATFSRESGNLLFVGGTGLGKTFLSACIAKTVADRGYSVIYETAGRLFSRLERAKFSDDPEARRDAERYTDCDLLILDDLGTEMPGQFVTAALYGILNDRLQSDKPMVVSTNLNVDEISHRYSPQIGSRLAGGFRRLIFVGEDIRVMKNRGVNL